MGTFLLRSRTVGAAVVAALAALPLLGSTAAAAEPADSYVALGDSFSSGNGTFSADRSPALICYRSSYAYPALVAVARPHTDLDFRACQGATTTDVIDKQVPALGAGTDEVSITIGGNDIGFVSLILACAGIVSPGCASTVATVDGRIRNELPAKLDRTYAAIRRGAPHARHVVVLGYPRFFGATTACPPAFGFTPVEASILNGVADHLDAVTGARAAAAGFDYRSAIAGFTGHDVCASDPYLNGSTLRVTDAFHPTRRGHSQVYAQLVRSVIG